MVNIIVAAINVELKNSKNSSTLSLVMNVTIFKKPAVAENLIQKKWDFMKKYIKKLKMCIYCLIS